MHYEKNEQKLAEGFLVRGQSCRILPWTGRKTLQEVWLSVWEDNLVDKMRWRQRRSNNKSNLHVFSYVQKLEAYQWIRSPGVTLRSCIMISLFISFYHRWGISWGNQDCFSSHSDSLQQDVLLSICFSSVVASHHFTCGLARINCTRVFVRTFVPGRLSACVCPCRWSLKWPLTARAADAWRLMTFPFLLSSAARTAVSCSPTAVGEGEHSRPDQFRIKKVEVTQERLIRGGEHVRWGTGPGSEHADCTQCFHSGSLGTISSTVVQVLI